MTIDQLLVKHSFSFILQSINSTFFKHLNFEIRNILAFFILSILIFCISLIFAIPLGFLSFFIKEILKKDNDKTIKTMVKNAFINLYNTLKNPPPNKFFTNSMLASLPLITLLSFFLAGWKITLPLLFATIICNEHIASKIHFRLKGIQLTFIFLMLYIYFCLIF